MALANPSLFLYGFSITSTNQFIDFQNVISGPILTATLPIGTYSCSGLLAAIVTAMTAADPANVYTATVDRTIAGGLQNRVTIATGGAFLSLLFTSGPHSASTPATLLGYSGLDLTGSITYSGIATAGTVLVTVYSGYTWVPPTKNHKVFGDVNVSAYGYKEAIVYAIQQFSSIEFKYEPDAKVEEAWAPLMDWMIQQNLFEFTPDYTQPATFFEASLESTAQDGKGLEWLMSEMLPQFPGLYQTGKLKFRPTISSPEFLP